MNSKRGVFFIMDIQKLTVTTKPFKILLIFLNDVPFNYIQHKILKKTAW